MYPVLAGFLLEFKYPLIKKGVGHLDVLKLAFDAPTDDGVDEFFPVGDAVDEVIFFVELGSTFENDFSNFHL